MSRVVVSESVSECPMQLNECHVQPHQQFSDIYTIVTSNSPADHNQQLRPLAPSTEPHAAECS